jgi:carbon storage regulator
MLVLKRKIGESVMIGEEIEIIVLERDGDSVRLGIRAPKNVSVYRKEIFEEIRQANQAALQSPNLEDLLALFQQTVKKQEK